MRVADIMTVLTEALSGAKARLEALRAEIEQHHRSVVSIRMNTAEDYGYESTDGVWGPGQYARNSELIGEREMIRMLIEQALEEARNDLSAIDDLPFTVSGLAAGGVAAAAPGMWSAQQTAFTTDLALVVLGQLDHGDTDAIRAGATAEERARVPQDRLHRRREARRRPSAPCVSLSATVCAQARGRRIPRAIATTASTMTMPTTIQRPC